MVVIGFITTNVPMQSVPIQPRILVQLQGNKSNLLQTNVKLAPGQIGCSQIDTHRYITHVCYIYRGRIIGFDKDVICI
jgi:hypothetical protein